MKRLMLLAALAMMVMQGCDKSGPDGAVVSQKAKEALLSKYPTASNIAWSAKGGYVVAAFSLAPSLAPSRATTIQRFSAWFNNQGEWFMTDGDMIYAALPEAVKVAFEASEYALWRVDEVDMIERPDIETIYIIEVEQGESEMDLYYSPDGVMIKQLADVDDDDDFEELISSGQNAEIIAIVKAKYPDARILEVDREGRYTEVEILDGRTKRELIFESGKWILTKTEFATSQVPAVVMDALRVSQYSNYKIDSVEQHKSATSESYRFELELGKSEVTIDITTDGVLTLVKVD